MKTYIEVKNQIDLVHRFADAPEQVAYLKNPHRHTFKISSRVQVFHNDREIEFYMLRDFISETLRKTAFCLGISCEQLAEFVIGEIKLKYGSHRRIIVSVFEDGINGAVVDTEEC